MKKLIRTGTMLLGACLVWAAGAKADGVRVFAASIGDETNRFVAGGESTDAQGNAGTMSPMTSSGSEDRSNVWREAFGTHGETIWTVFHHSEGDGDDDNDNDDNDRAGGSSSNGQGNGGTAAGSGGGGTGVVRTPEPSSLLLLAAGLLGLLGSAKKVVRNQDSVGWKSNSTSALAVTNGCGEILFVVGSRGDTESTEKEAGGQTRKRRPILCAQTAQRMVHPTWRPQGSSGGRAAGA